MGYIGNEAQTAFTSFDKQTITGTGTSVYTLSHSVANEQEIEVFVNNVRQEGGSGKAFTVSGNQITFSENIASTDTVYVNFQGKAVQTVSHPSDQPLQATTGNFSGVVKTPARPAFRGTKTYSNPTDFTTETDVTGYTEDFDIGSAFDASAGTYTIPETGIYQINVQQRATVAVAATLLKLRLYVDGSNDLQHDALWDDPESGQSSSMTICQTRSFTQGQVLKVSFESLTDAGIGAAFVFSGFFVG